MAKHGVCHIEWAVTDLKRAQGFYSGLFGWKFESWGEEYTVFKSPNIDGGLMKVDKVSSGKSPVIYIEVPEIESYAKKAKELGGKVTVPKTQINPSVGWFAHLTDPDGNLVGLFQGPSK